MTNPTITAAVGAAQDAYEQADHSPFDHGHAMVTDVDGRTGWIQDCKAHPQILVDTGGYHGTTLQIRGISRYVNAQERAYRAFLEFLAENGVERAEDASVWSRRD